MQAQLRDYQRAGVNFAKNVRRCGLFLDMGLGKSLIALTALTELAAEKRLYGHVLIIAPKLIATNTWPDEIEKWDHTKNARYKVLAGIKKKKRDKILAEVQNAPPTIYIINRDIISKLIDQFPGNKWPFLNVIVDEAQSFKNHASVGFKRLQTIAPFTHRWISLTGTPSPNGLMDIWAIIYLLDGGARLGPNITAYRRMHFDPGRHTEQGFPYEWLLRDGHEQMIHRQIRDIAISMRKEDYLDMPDIMHNTIDLTMSKQEKDIYEQLKRDKILPLLDGGVIEAANAAVLSGALMQLASGAIYSDETKTEVIELHEHKLNALDNIIDSSPGESVLCFYNFQHDKTRLMTRFPYAEVFDGSGEQLARWNNKQIPLLLAHPQSAGHGINFQHGGHILVFFSLPRSLEFYEQSIARLHRSGQTETVIVHYLIVKGTVEKKIMPSLMSKQLDQDALIDAVKATI